MSIWTGKFIANPSASTDSCKDGVSNLELDKNIESVNIAIVGGSVLGFIECNKPLSE